MADKLSAEEFALTGGLLPRARWSKRLYIDNASIAETEITDRVISWGTMKTAAMRTTPKISGKILLPALSVRVHNFDGRLSIGAATGYFPAGLADLQATIVRLVITMADTGTVFREFKGRLLQPDMSNERVAELFIEHGLVTCKTRLWRREDQIGGDTGATCYVTIP